MNEDIIFPEFERVGFSRKTLAVVEQEVPGAFLVTETDENRCLNGVPAYVAVLFEGKDQEADPIAFCKARAANAARTLRGFIEHHVSTGAFA